MKLPTCSQHDVFFVRRILTESHIAKLGVWLWCVVVFSGGPFVTTDGPFKSVVYKGVGMTVTEDKLGESKTRDTSGKGKGGGLGVDNRFFKNP